MAKLTPEQMKRAQSLKAVRGAERRLAQAGNKTQQQNVTKKKPDVVERTKGITNIIKKRANQASRIK